MEVYNKWKCTTVPESTTWRTGENTSFIAGMYQYKLLVHLKNFNWGTDNKA